MEHFWEIVSESLKLHDGQILDLTGGCFYDLDRKVSSQSLFCELERPELLLKELFLDLLLLRLVNPVLAFNLVLYALSQVNDAKCVTWFNKNVTAAFSRQNESQQTFGQKVDFVDNISILIDEFAQFFCLGPQIVCHPAIQTCRVRVHPENIHLLKQISVYLQLYQFAKLWGKGSDHFFQVF